MSDEEDAKNLLLHKSSANKNQNNVYEHQSNIQIRNNSCDLHFLHLCLLSGIVGLLFGYEAALGVNNIPKIKETISLDCNEQNAITTAWIIGAFLSSITGGFLVDKLGPKPVLSFTVSLLLACSLMASLTNSFIIFLSSRIFAGFAGALLLITQYVYVMESVTTKKCQVLLIIVLFATVSYLIPVFFSFSQISWRTVFGSSSFLACLTLIILLLTPSLNYHDSELIQKNNTSSYSSKVVQTIVLGVVLAVFCELMGHSTIRYYAPRILGMFGVCMEYQQNMAIILLNNLRALSIIPLIFTIDKIGKRCSIMLGTIIMSLTLIILGILSINDLYNITTIAKDNIWQQGNCQRVLTGTAMGYVIEPKIQQDQNTVLKPLLENYRTPYPFLPTPLALVASEPENTNSIDYLFNCKTDNGPWSDTSLSSKAAKLILIFLYESGSTLASSFMYWIIFCDIAPNFIRGRILGVMISIHWLSGLIVQSVFGDFVASFTLSGVFFLHSIACLIALLVSFLFIPEDHRNMNEDRFYFHCMLNHLRNIPGFNKPKIVNVRSSQSTAI